MKFIRGTGERTQRRQGVAVRKVMGVLVLPLFLSTLGHAQTLIYSWRDREGTIHIVDELGKVPLSHREDMRVYRIPFAREAKRPLPQAPSKPVVKVREGEEGALRGERPGEEIAGVKASITELRERLEELRQERETKRIRMARKRGRGKTVYREGRELETMDEEIELLADQLGNKMEALGSLEREKSRAGSQ